VCRYFRTFKGVSLTEEQILRASKECFRVLAVMKYGMERQQLNITMEG